MTMFSFTKVESWRNGNFVIKYTRLHQIASQISKFSRGDTPDNNTRGGGHPLASPLPARRFAPRLVALVAFGHSMVPLRVSYSP